MKAQLGVCYYPEHWPEEMWEQDARRMAAAGLSWVRIGEFAWSRIEPREGQFAFEWLDRAVEVLGGEGLKIVMGTPTATPPRWVLDKHPDMLAVDVQGLPRGFGSRRHYCFSHAGYREAAVRIATKMGQRYGTNPHVQAWQLDNEYGCHATTLSYSLSAQDEFCKWLAAKYQTIESLNEAWGNVFWSMEYASFDQIELPGRTVCEPNPAHVMDFRRFSSDQVAAFNRAQATALRELTDRPLIHNYMGRHGDFDHYRVGEDLDIAAWDSYPLGSLDTNTKWSEQHKQRYVRQGDPDFQAFHHDLYRTVGNSRWWVMEQQPGPVNWAPWNPAPHDGMVRLWTWEAIAHGAEVVSYFRWRQAPFAQEQMHAGLLRRDDVDAPALGEARVVAKELEEYGAIEQRDADVALVFDYESWWAWQIQPHGADFDYPWLCFEIYATLRKLGIAVDFVSADCKDFTKRKLVIIPALMCWNEKLADAISDCEAVVLGLARTGSKTENMAIPDPLPPAMPKLSCQVTRVESLRPGCEIGLQDGGALIKWVENLETEAEIVEKTVNGKPALVKERNRYYLGGWPDVAAMRRILSNLATEAGLVVQELPGGLRKRETASHCIWFNYDAQAIEYNEREFAPCSVTVNC